MTEDLLRMARERASALDPGSAAAAAGVEYVAPAPGETEGRFIIPFFGSEIVLSHPSLSPGPSNPDLPPALIALLVHHLAITDGSTPTGEWTSFGDLEDGGFYVSAFRSYTGIALAKRFAQSPAELEAQLLELGATPLEDMADRAWRVPALPKVPLALLWWDADEEFSARADLLFDSTALNHLPLDGCAIVGSWLTRLLTR